MRGCELHDSAVEFLVVDACMNESGSTNIALSPIGNSTTRQEMFPPRRALLASPEGSSPTDLEKVASILWYKNHNSASYRGTVSRIRNLWKLGGFDSSAEPGIP
jgi:hypothetical protein